MKFSSILFVFASLFVSSNALVTRHSLKTNRALTPVKAAKESMPLFNKLNAQALYPAIAALTIATPAHSAEMSAAFLPPIMVPLVGLIFPGFGMALAFLLVETKDLSDGKN
eukprot:CAMPEP_0185765652 /NCGR_PEP_ID=MMETSP1174-20130828/31005_1 /TAXON_ID=35687 /ORGANISM="Dictyocha speculum, Strain CCMP1381" /LENGTH=110 /DNA_ID=CAMNT_0028448913 /DNA_START=36 /DNA_END=368 /DNA_ORIENTATION=+